MSWHVSDYAVIRRTPLPDKPPPKQCDFIELGNECWSPVPYSSYERYLPVIGWVEELVFPIEVVEQAPYIPSFLKQALPLDFAHAALLAHRAMYREEKLVNALWKVGLLTRNSAYGRATLTTSQRKAKQC
jgi:hypothetical protein